MTIAAVEVEVEEVIPMSVSVVSVVVDCLRDSSKAIKEPSFKDNRLVLEAAMTLPYP